MVYIAAKVAGHSPLMSCLAQLQGLDVSVAGVLPYAAIRLASYDAAKGVWRRSTGVLLMVLLGRPGSCTHIRISTCMAANAAAHWISHRTVWIHPPLWLQCALQFASPDSMLRVPAAISPQGARTLTRRQPCCLARLQVGHCPLHCRLLWSNACHGGASADMCKPAQA